ncbi:exported protein of unknown function [Magnetospirillum sp. XM-1]|uniref:hypothetical protein n=1 Tax=Magnetospirillum sp. XM-1 TaxID=1663591 RepID=UPI00073DB816|nr:hypothetical protein [Magnetospirillum sp. XM-1]CUW38465.1 exported protein of unknown function [Magnetospirillum sp. XM-1]
MTSGAWHWAGRLIGARGIAGMLVGLLALLSAPDALAQAGKSAYPYCRMFPEARTVVFLVDRTATYEDEDIARLVRGWEVFATELNREGDHLVIRTVGDYARTSDILFDDCVPSCPPKGFLPWYDACNQNLIAADLQDFVTRIGQALNPVMLKQAQARKNETALAETISLVVSEHRPSLLVIFSDFLEYHLDKVGEADFYRANTTEMNSFYTDLRRRRLLPDLRNISVIGYGLGKELGPPSKPGIQQGMKLNWNQIYRWWVRYFSDAGARSISIETEYRGMTAPVPPGEAGPEYRTSEPLGAGATKKPTGKGAGQ